MSLLEFLRALWQDHHYTSWHSLMIYRNAPRPTQDYSRTMDSFTKSLRLDKYARYLQQDVNSLEKWEKIGKWAPVQQMSSNPAKCLFIHICSNPRRKRRLQYTIHGHVLEYVNGAKYLGVHVAQTHVNKIATKASSSLKCLRFLLTNCVFILLWRFAKQAPASMSQENGIFGFITQFCSHCPVKEHQTMSDLRAVSQQKYQCGICVDRRIWAARKSTQSDQNLRCVHGIKGLSLDIQ